MDTTGSSQRTTINSLPPSTKAKLRSTQILTSLPQVVSELIQNSLDSGARNIEASIDPDDWGCWVRDDGSGIPRDGLALLAGGPEIGRYSTSKAYSIASLDEVNTFGFRGEALASIANLCCLELSSRTAHSDQSWSVILKGEQTLYTGPSVRWRRESPGTVVSVRDAFYNLPIRRKAHPNATRTIELVRRDISAYALIFPEISFTLETTHKAKDGADRTNTRLLTVPKTSSTLLTFRHIYGKALATHVEEVNDSHDEMRLQGFFSLEGAYSKTYQFLYVNRHPVETCELHRSIEGVFARSSFGKHAYNEHGTNTPRSSGRRSPRKAEKKPVYVLNLTIPPRFVDNTIEPAKAVVQLQNSAAAATFLSSVVESLLVRHGFLSQRLQKSDSRNGAPPPRKIRKSTHVEGLDPSALLAGLSLNRFSSQGQGGLVPTDAGGPAEYSSAPSGKATSLLSAVEEEEDLIVGGQETLDILWKDPATGETFVVDARTGNSYPQNAPAGSSNQDASASSGTPIPRVRRSLGARDSARTAAIPAWIAAALQANDAYRIAEPKIPALPHSGDFVHRLTSHSCNHGSGARRYAGPQQRPFQPWDASKFARFSKDDLRQALTLGQVDRKFIACVMRSTVDAEDLPSKTSLLHDGGALVLIDQHAADERVQVERFFRELCEGFLTHRAPSPSPTTESRPDDVDGGVRTRKLDPPVHILLTRPEAERIAGLPTVREAFSRWGVILTTPAVPNTGLSPIDNETDDASYIQVAVNTVPEVVAEKLLAGDELGNLVKGFLARLEADGVQSALYPHDEGDSSNWQKALRWCPQELVELINSKACRGAEMLCAIMFNDSLTLEQCEGLVAKLSETDMPFQCAHGRPSLVPLVDTNGGAATGFKTSHINWSGFRRHQEVCERRYELDIKES